jgi:hypothetical protein
MRTPLVVGMDPGAEKGYALIDPEDMRTRRSWEAPRVVAMATSLGGLVESLPPRILVHRPIWAAVEFQYAQRVQTGEISADSIVKLAFRAGYMLKECADLLEAEEHFAATPQRWKVELRGSGANQRKDIFLARLLRELLPDELRSLQKIEETDDKNVDDVLDAIGIAWATWRVSGFPRRWREWRCDPETIIPYSPPAGTRKKRYLAAMKI